MMNTTGEKREKYLQIQLVLMNFDWIGNRPSRFAFCKKKNTNIYVKYNKKNFAIKYSKIGKEKIGVALCPLGGDLTKRSSDLLNRKK